MTFRTLKILASAYACEPGRGSEPGAGWNWIWHIAQLGHSVHVLTRAEAREPIERHLATARTVPDIRFSYVTVHPRLRPWVGNAGSRRHYIAWTRAAASEAARLECQENFDVLHHVTWSSLQGGSPLRVIAKPFVFGPVGGGQLAPWAYRAYLGRHWFGEYLRSFVNVTMAPYLPGVGTAAAQADLVLVTNTATAKLARRLGARNVELLLDSGLPDHGTSPPAPRPSGTAWLDLLWVGRLLPRKGLLLVLHALRQTTAPVRLTVVGSGPMETEIRICIARLDLGEKVHLVGQVPWHEVHRYYAESDVFLFSSLRDSFGGQLLEAASHGLPIITLDHHGAGDMIPTDVAVKIPVNDPAMTVADLAAAIDALHRDPDRRRRLGELSRRFAAQHSWTRKVEALTLSYDRAIRSAGSMQEALART